MTRPVKPARGARPIKERILDGLKNGPVNYHDLMRAVFPYDQYPKSWNRSANGGPVACARSFGKALNELGCREKSTQRFGRGTIHAPERKTNKAREGGGSR